MVFEFGDLLVQFASPQNEAYTVFHQELYQAAAHIHEIADAHEDEHHGEYASRIAYLMHFAVADGGQCDDGHVQGVI